MTDSHGAGNRRRVEGFRYGGGRQKHDLYREERKVSAGETSPTKTHGEVVQSSTGSIRWTPTQGGRFTLDRGRALEVIETKMRTFTPFNRELYSEFSKVLERLIAEEQDERLPEFAITATGFIPENNRMGRFIRIERKGKRYALPEGFRSLCRSAIQRKFNPRSNQFLFPGKKPQRSID